MLCLDVSLEQLKGFRTQVMLHLAGVLGGYLRTDAQHDEPLGNQLMSLQDFAAMASPLGSSSIQPSESTVI